jgi:hypothetical protein
MMDDPTTAAELGDLPKGDDEDEGLSATLQEALNLLERDYEEEFAASQILERSSLEKSLQERLDVEDADEADDEIRRKIG